MLEDIMREREKKLTRYEGKISAYPATVKKTSRIKDVVSGFSKMAAAKRKISLCGRIFSWRDQGKIIFADVRDECGKIQAVLKIGETDNVDFLKETVDAGDFVEVTGTLFTTKRGEKSILAKKFRVISKSLRPIPSSWYGIEDAEIKFRKRYLELLIDDDLKEVFRKRRVFWDEMREFLKENGFFEVEMPVFEAIPGGAEAEPFVTHHNALDRDFYLRISLELPLKKMLVAGFDSVFEIGRIFRNEGIDKEHLQDYTQMECYRSYWDYRDMMKFVEAMYKRVIKKTFGMLSFDRDGKKISWSGKWPEVDYYKIFLKKTGLDLNSASKKDLARKALELGAKPEVSFGRGRLIDLVYKKAIRPGLVAPCFLVNPPVDVEPLAKRSPTDQSRVERFQVLAFGTELGKGFSELNDPRDQRARFEEQMKLRAEGDAEAHRIDDDFLEALEYGMPPAAGFGVSERLFSALANKPVRETVIFPLVREETK